MGANQVSIKTGFDWVAGIFGKHAAYRWSVSRLARTYQVSCIIVLYGDRFDSGVVGWCALGPGTQASG